MRPSAIIFDLGETLFEPLPFQFTQTNLIEKIRSVGATASEAEIVLLYRECREQTKEEFTQHPFYKHTDLIREAFASCCKRLHCELTPQLVQDYAEIQGRHVKAQLKPRSDCFQTLRTLRDREFRLGIASNIDNDWLDPLIEKWDLNRHVDFILSSESAQSCKPDARIFQQSCELAACPPNMAYFVGDDEVNDIQGGRRFGLKTILLTSSGTEAKSEADVIVYSLTELLALKSFL